MKKNENQFKNINELIQQTKTNIINYIKDSYDKLLKMENNLCLKGIENLENSIQLKVKGETDKLIFYFKKNKGTEKIKEKFNKKEIRIESKSELNNFVSKDIEEENKEITRNFQNECYKYLDNPNEKVENENISLFFKEVARISRISYNEGKKLLKKIKEEYIKIKGNKILINNEKIRKEFSSWVKNLEKEKGRKEYENFIAQVKLFENYEDNEEQKKYLSKLFNDLIIMYFHCHLSFPLVEINFKKEDNFNSDKMIDFLNTGKNKKVNFIILPSLFCNGNFLDNGKSWVFTYYKDTFKFEDLIIESLDNLLDKEDLIPQENEENLSVKVYLQIKNEEKIITIDTNNNVFENKDYEICLYLTNKVENKTYIRIAKEKTFKINKNEDIKKYMVKKIIFSSENIIIKK